MNAVDRPNDKLATTVHTAFQSMIGIGTLLMGLSAWFIMARRRKRDLLGSRWFLRAVVLAGPLAVAALELGWITTEVGRQPWIAYRVMRITEAVTRSSGIWISFVALVIIYGAMGAGVAVVLRSMARRWREGASLDLPTPYSRPSTHSITHS